MANMSGPICAGDEDIVQVDEDKWQVEAQPVHHALEGVASIPEAKGHGKPLKQTKGGGMTAVLAMSPSAMGI